MGARGSVALLTHWRGVGIRGGETHRHTVRKHSQDPSSRTPNPPTAPGHRGDRGWAQHCHRHVTETGHREPA